MPTIRAALSTADIRAVTHMKFSSAIMVDIIDITAKMIRIVISTYILVTSKGKGPEGPDGLDRSDDLFGQCLDLSRAEGR